jgi:hypothetical protein
VPNCLLHKDKQNPANNAQNRHFVINFRQNFTQNCRFVIKNPQKCPFLALASRLKIGYVNGDNKAVHTDSKRDY